MALLRLLRRRRTVPMISHFPPIAGGAPKPGEENDDPKGKDDDPAGKTEPAKGKDDPEKKDDDGEEGDDDDGKVDKDDDWKTKSRKNENRAKRAEKEAAAAEAELKKLRDEDKSERDKAVDAAREEGEKKAREEGDKERRSDRLEVAVTRIAAKGVEVGEGDEAKSVKFDDPGDALVFVERKLAKGELDKDDIFDDDGKVNAESVEEALVDLLKEKPKLAADAEGQKPAGDPDTRKGKAGKDDIESASVEDHAERKYPAKK